MDIITAITKERGRLRIMVNEDSEVLVPLSLFRERPLSVGDAIDMEEYDQWLLLRQYRHALDRAVAFLAGRARSRREMEERLLRSGYRPCTVEMVLFKLEKEGLLDDADFARQWVSARSARRMGRGRIAQELRRKGVSAQEAEEALESLSEEEQLEGAMLLVKKSLSRAPSGEEPRKTAARITAMLARRGYGYDVAREAISRLMESTEE